MQTNLVMLKIWCVPTMEHNFNSLEKKYRIPVQKRTPLFADR